MQTLVDADIVARNLGDPSWVVVDCRFSLADPERGRKAHRAGTIPGAIYAHLDEDLSGSVIAGKTGRHPLPEADVLCARLGGWGISPEHQVVAFDDAGGPFAARLWWLLRWLGHSEIAVLDGGLRAWQAAGHRLESPGQPRAPVEYRGRPQPRRLASVPEVQAASDAGTTVLLDARDPARFRGEVEPIDAEAGHIPGARNLSWKANLDGNGRFLAPPRLRRRFEPVLGNAEAICYCGSGVTACHDILAIVHAGLSEPKLYAGSWSGWITDPDRPRAKGA